jgi:hypothetical protein
LQCEHIISLKNGKKVISNPQKMADMLNSFFTDSVVDLLARNTIYSPAQTSQQRIQYQMNTMFWLPITEIEIERVIRSLKGKSSAGFDEIPEYLAKKMFAVYKKTFSTYF